MVAQVKPAEGGKDDPDAGQGEARDGGFRVFAAGKDQERGDQQEVAGAQDVAGGEGERGVRPEEHQVHRRALPADRPSDDLGQDHSGQHGAAKHHWPPGVLGQQPPRDGEHQDDDRQTDGAEDNGQEDHDGRGRFPAQRYEPGAHRLVNGGDTAVLQHADQDGGERHGADDH